MFKKLFNPKAIILAFETALLITLFLGIFANSPMNNGYYKHNWYYLNRGYPAWNGVALKDRLITPPLIKMPFLGDIDTFVKILDIRIFIPVFFGYFFLSYVLAIYIINILDKYRYSLIYFMLLNFSLILATVYVYFSWFRGI